MRMLRDHQHSVYVQYGYPPGAQHNRLTVASIQQLWNEWEIQCLVLASFSMQVFLLFFAGFRKCYRSRVLSVLLWLAYLSADTVAVFVLGHLTCVVRDDPRQQMVLFWAPFMLLHLGGQDTITAFSMEDCALWKRHLLNLTTQVALAIYVVGKQWQGDKQLVAPMVLIFISGTAKYMERIWILGRAGSWGPISRPWGSLSGQKRTLLLSGQKRTLLFGLGEYGPVRSLFSYDIEVVAHDMFYESMNYFMNRSGKLFDRFRLGREDRVGLVSDEGVHFAYKLAATQLSLIYDLLYTKFGSLDGVLNRLTILAMNSTALVLFVVHHKKGHSAADVAISYILLVGAVALEISSIFMWLMTSYWPYKVCPRGGHSPRIVLSILKCLRPAPESKRLEWSGKLQQYNLIDEIIQEKARKEYGWLKWMMWRMGIKQYHHTSKDVVVSPEVKKVFLDKLCDHALKNMVFPEWKARHFGQEMDVISRAFVWHLVTDMCLVRDETPSKSRTCSQHLSNYMMHLVYKCNLMVDADGRLLLKEYIQLVGRLCGHHDKRQLVQIVHRDNSRRPFGSSRVNRAIVTTDVHRVHRVLNGEVEAADRWEMITTVWMEMLYYITRNCDHGFHAKQLSAGGEFLTHVKMLMFLVLKQLD